jgi:hypothetical protein
MYTPVSVQSGLSANPRAGFARRARNVSVFTWAMYVPPVDLSEARVSDALLWGWGIRAGRIA